MGDLENPRWIIAKGFLFLLLGLVAAALVWLENPRGRTAVLLVLAIWGCARFYYFAFYVIEHYVDSHYKFSGLLSFVRYWFTRRPPPE